MRFIVLLMLCLVGRPAAALELEDRQRFGPDDAATELRVLSSTDTGLFAPILARFIARNPGTAIDYQVAGSAQISAAVIADPAQFDVVISSAMDLQIKLVNDGYARTIGDAALPDWTHWRRSLFGFTREPAVILLRRSAFRDLPLPTTRQELITVMRQNPDRFGGKVGTYDIRASGLGYLFATQDARSSETYWRLMEVMGALDVQLYCCSGDMIDALATGRINVAYNVIGSYAAARRDVADLVSIVDPTDFQTTMMRTVLMLKDTAHPDAAEGLIRFLVGGAWATQGPAPLPSLSQGPLPSNAPQGLIQLDPGLMVHLDRLKRRQFLQAWQDALVQD